MGCFWSGDHPRKASWFLKHRTDPAPIPGELEQQQRTGFVQPPRCLLEARINILFNQGLGVNTVYPGSVQRKQLRPCGAGPGTPIGGSRATSRGTVPIPRCSAPSLRGQQKESP